MKKIYLFTLILTSLTFYGIAQSVTLISKAGILGQNTTLIQAGTPDSSELVTYVDVKNITTEPVNIFCKKSVLSVMDSTESVMCWADGCYPSWVTVSPVAKTIDPGETVSEFSGHYVWIGKNLGFTSGESVIRWVFYNAIDMADSVSLTVYYTTYGAGLSESGIGPTALSNGYPNPANNRVTIGYSIPAGTDGAIVIRDVLGSAKKTVGLEEVSGKVSINTSDLGSGIYFYSLEVNGKTAQSKKLVVRH